MVDVASRIGVPAGIIPTVGLLAARFCWLGLTVVFLALVGRSSAVVVTWLIELVGLVAWLARIGLTGARVGGQRYRWWSGRGRGTSDGRAGPDPYHG
jgi:hypothetical protein